MRIWWIGAKSIFVVTLGVLTSCSMMPGRSTGSGGAGGEAAPQETAPVATPASPQPAVRTAVRHDVSPALSSAPPPPARAEAAFVREHRVKPLPAIPRKEAAFADNVVQATATAPLAIQPIDTFEGVGEGMEGFDVTSFPADTTGAVGTTQYVQWVNTSLAVFDKSTKKLVFGPRDGNVLWRGFGGSCEALNDGDPIVLFDRIANRWVLSQFAVNNGAPFSQCLAVSTSADATGTYNRYEFQYKDFNDYGKLGVWPDGYYATFNMFGAGDSFLGAKVCAYERDKILAGKSARMICFDVANEGGLLPADLEGSKAPPAGSPNYVMDFGSDKLNLWRFKVNWKTPSASSLSGPVAVKTAPFTPACENAPTPGTCVVQPNSTVRLDTLSDRLMYRLAYRNFDAHESLVVDHSVDSGPRVAVRWYEVRDPNGTPQIHQQGTYASTKTSRWMGSVAMDKAGDIVVGYNTSSASVHPSIRLAGRAAGDPLNKLSKEVTPPKTTGTGSQSKFTRWGDYSTMTIDPTDDCSFWYTAQYESASTKHWHTAIVHSRFTACQ